jgi:uncharacterized Zn finger protein (UPF0148 family)
MPKQTRKSTKKSGARSQRRDPGTTFCPNCGKEVHRSGVSAHNRGCRERPAELANLNFDNLVQHDVELEQAQDLDGALFIFFISSSFYGT